MRALLEKELAEHRVALAALALLELIFVALTMLGTKIISPNHGVLEGYRLYLTTGAVLGAFVISSRIVTREYTGQTQLFLETLPVTRAEVLASKMLIALAAITAITAVPFFLAVPADLSDSEPLDLRFLIILAVRAGAFTLFLFAATFLFGMLGRYRFTLAFAALLLVFIVSRIRELDLTRFGPFALMNSTYAYERTELPVTAVLWSIALALAGLGASALLALVREGSVSAHLAQKGSRRERTFVFIALISLAVVGSVADERITPKPFDLADAMTAEGDGVTVKLAPSTGPEAEARRAMIEHLHRELVELARWLGVESLPPVFVIIRQDLDADVFERGKAKGAAGVILRVHHPAQEWRDDVFVARVVREVLVEHTKDRADHEPNRWLLDGFAWYWARRAHVRDPLEADRDLLLRALYAGDISKHDLETWYSFRDRAGDGIAGGVAWSILRVLAREAGEQETRAFVRAIFLADTPRDLRALWRSPELERVLEEHTKLTLDALLARRRETLAPSRAALAAELEVIPRLAGTIASEPISEASRRVRYRLTSGPEGSARVRFQYLELATFNFEIEPDDFTADEREASAAREGRTLPRAFAPETRLGWTFATDAEALGCEVISGWTRQELE